MWAGSTDVEFPFAKGENDSKSPDKSFIHTQCGCQCVFPTVVVEVGFSQRNNDLQEKAETYIRRSNGEIRAVVGVDMYKMFQAEKRNELRLKKKYMAGELDGTGSYVYAKDENNETAEGSIVVWRPTFGRGGKVGVIYAQNEVLGPLLQCNFSSNLLNRNFEMRKVSPLIQSHCISHYRISFARQ